MRSIPRSMSLAAFIALSIGSGASVWAADPVTDAMQQAYGPYRVALFRTNSGSVAESQQAIAQAQATWSQIVSQFGSKPAAPYDRDTKFVASLSEVTAVYAKAADEVSKNQLSNAHETLERARDVMAEMRQRNNVIVFSDHMNAYHAQMEHVLIEGVKLMDQPQGLLQLLAQVGALEYLASQMGTQAPASLTSNPEFMGSLKAVQQSVADLKAALLAQDAAATKAAIGKIKGPYSKMFLKFG
ncbi:MAG: hypothetical protein KGN32_05770 [Burkholderiales bacterium]|nr:hypothetical protein [Burkholderiales bacterium]